MKSLWIGLLAAVVSAAFTMGAQAAEIRVLTAGAFRSALEAVRPDFEKRTGHTLSIDKDTAGGLGKRIGGGEAFDVTIITPKVIDELIAAGNIAAGSRRDVAKVGMGVAIRQGAKAPDISTTEAFKRTLIEAKSVAYIDPKAGGSSGIYFDKLLERLGIADQVRPKAKLKQGGYVAELVASGEAEIAVHQISEIVPVEGVTLVGPLPPDIQNITVYSAGLAPVPRDAAAAKAFVDALTSPEAAKALAKQGMEKP